MRVDSRLSTHIYSTYTVHIHCPDDAYVDHDSEFYGCFVFVYMNPAEGCKRREYVFVKEEEFDLACELVTESKFQHLDLKMYFQL